MDIVPACVGAPLNLPTGTNGTVLSKITGTACGYGVRPAAYNDPENTDYLARLNAEQPLNSSGLVLSPNPTSDRLKVQYNFNTESVGKINIKDFSGRLLVSKDYNFKRGNQSYYIDVSMFKPRLYIIEFSTNDQWISSKFSIQK